MWWYPDRRLIRTTVRTALNGSVPIGPPVRMVILVQPPTSAISAVVLTTNPVIGFIDVYGNLVPAPGAQVTATGSVGTMSGTTTVGTNATGIAAFSNLKFDAIGGTPLGNRSITFTCAGFTAVVSNSVSVSDPLPLPALHLDATIAATITTATGVSAWTDKNGNGRTVTQATPASQPLRIADLINHNPAIRFDGVDDFMSFVWPAALQLNTGSTLFIVAKPRFVPALVNQPLIRWLPSNATGMQAEATTDPVVPSRGRLEAFTSTNAGLKRATPVPTVDLLARVASVIVDPGAPAIKLYRDGVLEGGPTAGFATITSSVGDELRVARDESVSGQFGAYDIGEIIVFPSVLTDTQRQSYEGILIPKWIEPSTAPSRGPILLANSVIDGVTIIVNGWHSSGTPDFASSDYLYGRLTFQFSEPIKRFRATLVFGQSAPIQWYRLIQGVNNYTGAFSYDIVPGAGAAYAPGVNDQTVQINDTVTGFTTVITQLAPISGAGFGPTSVFKDCYFSKMSDP